MTSSHRLKSNARLRRPRRSFCRQHFVESLERRNLLTTFVVNNVNELGDGSLNKAILDANRNSGLDFIHFEIPGAGLHTIRSTFPFPTITDPVVIDGTTQLGFNTPVIELDGSLAGPADGLNVTAGNTTIQGLVINRFERDAIVLSEAGNNTIQHNFLGTDATGTIAKSNRIGIHISASPNNVINDNLISGNTDDGIEIDFAASTGNVVKANRIGTDVTGVKPLGNGLNGISLVAPAVPILRTGTDDPRGYASKNVIGGTDTLSRNIIGGNASAGVHIFRGTGNEVLGNYIGVGKDGVSVLPNGTDSTSLFGRDGIWIEEGSENRIGDSKVDAGNLISGNLGAGIRISAAVRNANANRILGNLIGTDSQGEFAVGFGNHGDGLDLLNESAESSSVELSGNIIGGVDLDDGKIDGTVRARNVISGNGDDGISILGLRANDTTIRGNFIGLNLAGDKAVKNANDGIHLSSFLGQTGASSVTRIGGPEPGAGNTISANGQDGLLIGPGARADVYGNRIGTNATGTDGLGNVRNGILILNSSGSRVGGVTTLNGEDVTVSNLIAANGLDGIQITGEAVENTLAANIIGTDVTESTTFGNGRHGVAIIDASSNHVGDGTTRGRNVIVNNAGFGLVIVGANAKDNTARGNYLGVATDGKKALGNSLGGVSIRNASANTIGGPTNGDRNVISGNQQDGVHIGLGAFSNHVLGNFIGVDAEGVNALGNARHGIVIVDSHDNDIGGEATPLGTAPGNVVSGNRENGIFLGLDELGGGTTRNQVLGNIIGLDVTGTAAIPNQHNGVVIQQVSGNVIGGSIFAGGNVISGNEQFGVLIFGASATGNQLFGNLIGTDVRGTSEQQNKLGGVVLSDASGNVIGSESAARRNVISGNGSRGVVITGQEARANLLQGNFIGTTFVGDKALANRGDGLFIDDAPGTVVGGTAVGAGNIVAANQGHGIVISGAHATNSQVLQNSIGTGVAGTEVLGNVQHGVFVRNDASNNRIGDTSDRAGNRIAHNGSSMSAQGHGVVIASGTGNAIRHNQIFANAGRGIDLVNTAAPDTFTLNDYRDDDNGANGLQDYPVITSVRNAGGQQVIGWTLDSTPNAIFQIDFFDNSTQEPSGFGEGEKFLFSIAVATNDKGVVHFEQTFALNARISATATNNGTHDTSEFSLVDADGDALADTWESVGIDIDEDGVVDYVLPGANPQHKDLYLEIDAMLGLAPTLAVRNRVEAAFRAAPVTNPDGSNGIDLHITLDETIPRQPWTADLNGDGVDAIGEDRDGDQRLDPGEDTNFNLQLDPGDPADQDPWLYFNRIKQGLEPSGGGFGLLAERANPKLIASKRLVSRYAIFADRWAKPANSIGTILSTSGKSEIGGNDLFVSLGLSSAWTNSPDEQTGVLMHEFGHTLGLHHGGTDDDNHKPNYHSQMNYVWQMPNDWMDEAKTGIDGNGDGDTVDNMYNLGYSEIAFPALNENNLDESSGIGGHPNHFLQLASLTTVTETGPVDWSNNDKDGDGISDDDTHIKADINKDSRFTELAGAEDWSRLHFGFLEDPEFADGVTEDESNVTVEMDFDEFEQLNSLGSGPGVFEFRTGKIDVSESTGIVTVTVRRGGGTVGDVTIDYATVNGTAVAENGGDFTATSGTLSFADGEYLKTFDVAITADALGEPTETLQLVLSNPTGGARFGDDVAVTLNILDDDGVVRMVTNTNDSGPGSLRQAILDANAQPGFDIINFNVGQGVATISPVTNLPPISGSVLIDGTSQPGYRDRPIIEINGQAVSNGVGLNIAAPDTTIRGLVINRFASSGINAANFLRNVAIENNFIGTDVTGTASLGNGTGMTVGFGVGLRIGGSTPNTRNVISGNRLDGILVTGGAQHVFQGNFIGVAANGFDSLGNGGDGVRVSGSPTRVTIGGPEFEHGNVIAFNQGSGVASLAANRQTAILSNSIHSNRQLGIRRDPNAATVVLNDIGTSDGFRDNLQNYPVLFSATQASGTTTISGYLNSTPNSTFLLQFFSNTNIEPNGFGEGETLLCSQHVTTDFDGHLDFTVSLPIPVADGRLITATATSVANDTSEFSRRLAVGEPLSQIITVNSADDIDDGIADERHTSLREAIHAANNFPGSNEIRFAIGSGVRSINLRSQLPRLVDRVTIDGTSQPGFAGAPLIELNGSGIQGTISTGLIVNASNTIIRGLVINGFSGGGVDVFGIGIEPTFRHVIVEGNYIGTDVTGLLPRPNARGIGLFTGDEHVVGGSTAAARNVISGNVADGILVDRGDGHRLMGNVIGVGSDGVSPVPNGGHGVAISPSVTFAGVTSRVSHLVVGGLDAGTANVIAFNGRSGIQNRQVNNGNAILSNSIHSNQLLGISLNSMDLVVLNERHANFEGATPVPYPVLYSAQVAGNQTTILGTLNAEPASDYLLQFFSNSVADASGFGEGERFLISVNVTTDSAGQVDFSVVVPTAIATRQFITATATNRANNTSQFSRRLAVGEVLTGVITVNTTDDTDDGFADATHTSLREALHAANNHPGHDIIRFAIGNGVQSIVPLTPLPVIVDSVVVDGWTQPGFIGTPVVELSGVKMMRDDNGPAATDQYLTGLSLLGDDITIRGLVINQFFELLLSEDRTTIVRAGGSPLQVLGNRNVIEGVYVGTNVAGTAALGNLNAVNIRGSENRVGGTTAQQRNLFAGARDVGVSMIGTDNLFLGNYVGTNAAGTAAIPNGRGTTFGSIAVDVRGSNNRIGGTATGAGNLISGNFGDALVVSGRGHLIEGNFIGTNASGSSTLPNVGDGITLTEDSRDEPGIRVGGTEPGARNLVAGNRNGVVVRGAHHLVQGNFIGTNLDGTVALGNLNAGITLLGEQHVIGGAAVGAGNLISGNNVGIFGFSGSQFVIQGNRIGTDVTGSLALRNASDGVLLGGDDHLIGGAETGAANIIAFNGKNGVTISNGHRIGIMSNSIHSNAQLGIDLNDNGPSVNDANDADTGSNDLQNFPVLATALTDGTGRSQVAGTLVSQPNTTYIVQVFANDDSDSSGFGEGQTLLGSLQLTTDNQGSAPFVLAVNADVPVGKFVTATASDPANNTSEFATPIVVAPGNVVVVNQPPTARAGGPYVIDEGFSLSLDGSSSSDPDNDLLTYAWDLDGDGDFGDASGRSPTLTWPQLGLLGIHDGPAALELRVRVNDGQGHESTSAPATVTVRNVAPTADAGDDQFVLEGFQVSLSGTVFDPSAEDDHVFHWHVVADNGQVIADRDERDFEFLPTDNGTYTITFTVTDSDGDSGSDAVVVTVFNVAPNVAAGPDRTVKAGEPVAMVGEFTDPGVSDTHTFHWSVMDETGQIVADGTSQDFEFTPHAIGVYTVIFTVTDDDGDGQSSFVTVTANDDQTALPGDTNLDGQVNGADIDTLCQAVHGAIIPGIADLDHNGTVDFADMVQLVTSIMGTTFGDATLDGTFNSSDLIEVLTAGQYEDQMSDNSTWQTGDWDCDRDFTTADLVIAFQFGGYSSAAHPFAVAAITPQNRRTDVSQLTQQARARLDVHDRRTALSTVVATSRPSTITTSTSRQAMTMVEGNRPSVFGSSETATRERTELVYDEIFARLSTDGEI